MNREKKHKWKKQVLMETASKNGEKTIMIGEEIY